jgi:hypothetical protein
MGPVMEVLSPLLPIVDGLTLPVKIAWLAWLVWGTAQLAWLAWRRREARPRALPTSPPSGVRRSAVRPPVRKSAVHTAPATSPYGTSDFIAALDEEQAAVAAGDVEPGSAYR